jgi:hypothetical protein
MIAPLPGSQPPQLDESRPLEEARRWIASTFLRNRSSQDDHAAPVRPWKAWLFTAWVLIVTAVYFAGMFGLFSLK